MFIIPLIIATLLIVGVFGYKLYSEGTIRTKAAETPVQKLTPALQTVGGKPSTGYGALKGPTPTVSPTSGETSLEDLVEETDDTGETDFKAIDASAAQL